MGRNTPHNWNTLEDFLIFHDRQIIGFDHFILQDTLSFELTDNQIFVRGRLFCGCDTYLDVEETVVREDAGCVRTVKYSYHAGMLFPNRHDLFRYDNAHAHRGRADAHHKHIFDPESGNAVKPPIWVGEAK